MSVAKTAGYIFCSRKIDLGEKQGATTCEGEGVLQRRGLQPVSLGVIALVVSLAAHTAAQTTWLTPDTCTASVSTLTSGALDTRLIRNLHRLYCADNHLAHAESDVLRQQHDAARRQAISALKQNLSSLNWSVLRGLLTLQDAVHLQPYKEAFKAVQHQSHKTATLAFKATTPAEVAAVRRQFNTESQAGFDQMAVALLELVPLLNGAAAPDDSPTAEMGFPSPGSQWVTRTTTHSGRSIDRAWVILPDRVYRDQTVHRRTNGKIIRLYDTETGNWVATTNRSGVTRVSAAPHNGLYHFPLWVGKSWLVTYTYEDPRRGKTLPNQVRRVSVVRYEEVSVPAGTFKAFQLYAKSFATQIQVWYAPELKLEVKWVVERLPSHYRGPGQSTHELISYWPVQRDATRKLRTLEQK